MAIDTGGDLRDLIAARGVAATVRAVTAGDGPAGVALDRAKERRDASTAVFTVDGRRLAVVEPRGRPGDLEAWWLPDDPRVPGLPAVGALCAEPGMWRPVTGGGPPPPGLHAREVVYRPGQRAIFLLEDGDGVPRRVLRLLRAVEYRDGVGRGQALVRAGVPRALAMPALEAAADAPQALLTGFVPGRPVSEIDAGLVRGGILARLLATAATLHRMPPVDLPEWTPSAAVDRAAAIVSEVVGILPGADEAHLVGRAFSSVAERVAGSGGWEPRLIHGDLGLRNAVYDASTDTLGVIDWDNASRGPAERDVAALVSGARRVAPRDEVLDLYRASGGPAVNEALVDALVALQRLLKLCRRLAAGGDTSALEQEVLLLVDRR